MIKQEENPTAVGLDSGSDFNPDGDTQNWPHIRLITDKFCQLVHQVFVELGCQITCISTAKLVDCNRWFISVIIVLESGQSVGRFEVNHFAPYRAIMLGIILAPSIPFCDTTYLMYI